MKLQDISRRERLMWLVLTVPYAVSFFLPAFRSDDKTMLGYQAFAESLRWSDMFPAFWILLWCANPLFWLGSYFLVTWRWDLAMALGCAALLLELSWTLLFHFFSEEKAELALGYYVWLSSMVALIVCGRFGERFLRSDLSLR